MLTRSGVEWSSVPYNNINKEIVNIRGDPGVEFVEAE